MLEQFGGSPVAFRDECVRVMSGPDEFTPRRFFVEKLLATMEYGNNFAVFTACPVETWPHQWAAGVKFCDCQVPLLLLDDGRRGENPRVEVAQVMKCRRDNPRGTARARAATARVAMPPQHRNHEDSLCTWVSSTSLTRPDEPDESPMDGRQVQWGGVCLSVMSEASCVVCVD